MELITYRDAGHEESIESGQLNLPVAPRRNIQCHSCRRRFEADSDSCLAANNVVLSPGQAMAYLRDMLAKRPEITQVGIAGPGDPFAMPKVTLRTLRLIRKKYPDMFLFLVTNGLELAPFIDELIDLAVGRVTITLNAVDPEIGQHIYQRVRYGKRMYHGMEAASLLLAKQMKAIERLVKTDIVVAVNTVVIPGINDDHINAVQRTLRRVGMKVEIPQLLVPAPDPAQPGHCPAATSAQ